MRLLRKALREIAYAIGVFVVAIITGGLLYRLIGDVFRGAEMDRSADAASGAGVAFALLVLVVHVAVRILRRNKPPNADVMVTSSGPSPRRKRLRTGLTAVGSVVLALLLYAGVHRLRRGDYAYGPAAAEQLDLVVAPDVSVELLPSARSLAAARFEAFDVSPAGAVLVSTASRVVDLASGKDLFAHGTPVRSFAFAGGALAVIDGDGRLGFYEAGQLHVVGESPVTETRLIASSDRSRLLFLRGGYDSTGTLPALVSMRAGSAPEALTGSFTAFEAAGGDALQTVFSRGNALFQIITPGHPSLRFVLPEAGQSILGIAVAGTAVYFATAQAVYVLADGIAVPLVLGLGGDLRIVGGALYVLEPRYGRVYRIVVAGAPQS